MLLLLLLLLSLLFASEKDIASCPFGSDSEALLSYASTQWEKWGPRLLAAGLALLLQRQQRIAWVSCLSGRQNCVPLLFYDPLGTALKTRSDLLQLLKLSLSGHQLSLLGRIALTRRGFAVDMPPALAYPLKASPYIKQRGLKVIFLSSLPPVVQQQHVIREEIERRRGLQARKRGAPTLRASPRARRYALLFIIPAAAAAAAAAIRGPNLPLLFLSPMHGVGWGCYLLTGGLLDVWRDSEKPRK